MATNETIASTKTSSLVRGQRRRLSSSAQRTSAKRRSWLLGCKYYRLKSLVVIVGLLLAIYFVGLWAIDNGSLWLYLVELILFVGLAKASWRFIRGKHD